MNPFIIAAITVFVFMNLMFLLSIWKNDNSIVDIGWGIGFVLVIVSMMLLGTDFLTLKMILVSILTLIWGYRISSHINARNKGKPEDFRYKNWRKQWGKNFYIRSYFQVYMLQGLMMYIISLPAILIFWSGEIGFGLLDLLGLMIWIFGYYFESVGDRQLKEFKSKPKNKGKIMTEGLWKYTRHPNYFGEAVMWWGIFLLALNVDYGIYTIISPLTINYLLRFVSGVPMLEKKYKGNRQFEKYKKRTNAFLPWFPCE